MKNGTSCYTTLSVPHSALHHHNLLTVTVMVRYVIIYKTFSNQAKVCVKSTQTKRYCFSVQAPLFKNKKHQQSEWLNLN